MFCTSPSTNKWFIQWKKLAITYAMNTIHRYVDTSQYIHFDQNVVLTGTPGSVKTCLLNYIALYTISRGLKAQ